MIQRVACRFVSVSAVGTVLLMLLCGGCQSLSGRALVPYDAAAGLFDRATIHYEIDAGNEGLPISVTRIDGRLVSYEPLPTDPLPQRTLGVLDIHYPHPARGADWALATVRIESRIPVPLQQANTAGGSATTTREQTIEETWQLDITRDELTSLVAALSASGYFESKRAAADEVAIETRLDGTRVRRRWRHVPALDGLMRRVRSEGQLMAYHRSPTLSKPISGGFSALAVLRGLRQKGQYHLPARNTLGRPPVETAAANNPLFASPTASPSVRVANLPSAHLSPEAASTPRAAALHDPLDAAIRAQGRVPANAPTGMSVVP